MGKKINLENTCTVQNYNGEWMCIWKGTGEDGREVWCRIGQIFNCDEIPPPKGEPFGSRKRKKS